MEQLKEILEEIGEKEELRKKDSFVLADMLAGLDSQKSKLKKKLDNIKEQREKIEEILMEKMSENGIQNINAGDRTIYIHRQYWAGAKKEREQLVQALKDIGMQDYVKENYNTHSISAWVRERIEEYENENDTVVDDPIEVLPEELQEEMKISEKVQLRSRRA